MVEEMAISAGDRTEAGGFNPLTGAPGNPNPWLITVLVAFGTFMELLDVTVANVALPYVAGGLGVSEDEASWVITTYLIANAIVVTASSFLAKIFGRKKVFIVCLTIFTVTSVLCGLAVNLQALLSFRILQGLGGGGLVPIAQSILATSFPPSKRGQAFALYGAATVVAPVVGPTLGGWLSDNYGWQWCFLINGPIGIVLLAAVYLILPDPQTAVDDRRRLREQGISFDLLGFLLVATFLGSLEVVLDRGLEDDWLDSNFITTCVIVCCLAFVLMIPWEITHRNPVVDIRMFAKRQFAACFLAMLAAGAILITTTQFLPLLVQQNFGYTATLAGLILSPGALVSVAMMLVVGRLSAYIQAKYMIATGATIIAFSMFGLTNLYGDVDFQFFALSRIYVGVGLSLMTPAITRSSYEGVPRDKLDQGAALITLARNVGSSIGVSLGNNTLAHREQFHHGRLVELTDPSGIPYQEMLKQVTKYFIASGSSLSHAQHQALAWIGSQIQRQASLLAFIDVFWTLMLIAAATVPLALLLRKVEFTADSR
jgi:MFS transporter, DHA2 family, multidrug resistance protein